MLIFLFWILTPMLLFANLQYIFNFAKLLGVRPRELSLLTPLRLLTNAFVHLSLKHFVANMVWLIPGLVVFYFIATNPFEQLLQLIIGASFLVWAFGSPNSYHAGASGLVYAIIGFCSSYLYLSAKFNHNPSYYVYLVAFYVYAGAAVLYGLMPDKKTSFVGHFGGFLFGLMYPFLVNVKV